MKDLLQIAISDYLDQGVLFLDEKCCVLFWNKWLERHSQLKREAVIGKPLGELFPEIVNRNSFKQMQLSLKHQNSVILSPSIHQYFLPLKPSNALRVSGETNMFQLVRGCYVNYDDNNSGLLLFITDVTEKYLSEKLIKKNIEELNYKNQKLEQTENLLRKKADELGIKDTYKTEFLRNVTHELRTPLNGIKGFSELLLSEELSQEQFHFCEQIKLCSDSLLDIVNDLLDLSKVEAGKLTLDMVPLDMEALVTSVYDLMKPKLSDKNIELICDIDSSLPIVQSDPIRLKQILTNFIGNSIKFTRQGEVLTTVRKTRENRNFIMVEICVKDSGIGIPKNKQNLIFDAFVQADSSTTRIYGGTGLGLTINQKLISYLGGEILGVESEIEVGTSFLFTVKLKKVVDAVYHKPTPFHLKNKFNRCLILDDNKTFSNILEKMLNEFGITCDCKTTMSEAFEKINTINYDLIIIDYGLDNLDKSRLFGEIANSEPDAKPFCIAVSMCHRKCIKSEEIDDQLFDVFLSKPIGISKLFSALESGNIRTDHHNAVENTHIYFA